jgi:hypothetical protein
MTDFASSRVAHGLKFLAFNHLSPRDKKKLIRLMARIAEKSSRRGFQHGTLGMHTIGPVKFRFEVSLDKSPFTDGGGYNPSAVERLFGECRELGHLGFDQESQTREKLC